MVIIKNKDLTPLTNKDQVMNAWDCLNDNEKKAVESLKSKLTERFDVRDMRLFGSKARGQAGLDSDVDIMIELAHRSPGVESENRRHYI